MTRPITTARRPRVLALLLGLALALGLLPLLPRPAAAAAAITVTSTGDAADLDPADDVCDANPAPGAQCTLRAAIQEAGSVRTVEPIAIAFAIPGPGVHTIAPASALPQITAPVIIDGYTQPGARANTLAAGTNAILRVQLDGSNARAADGLVLAAANSVVKGLVVNRFENAGIRVAAPGVRVAGCFVGTNPAGTAARRNGQHGVAVFNAGAAVVGGATPAARNLLAGNRGAGVSVSRAAGVRVQGNLIGTDATGAAPLGNGGAGVDLDNAFGAAVGGGTAAAANTIAFNAGDGVRVFSGPGNRIGRNAIFANGGLGIDLGDDGPTANDLGDPSRGQLPDADDGANTLQNTPVLTAATITVEGRLNSTPNAAFVLRFYANPPGGNEGKTFVGQASVTTDANGDAPIRFAPAPPIPLGRFVTATATNAATGDTSEFSPPALVEA